MLVIRRGVVLAVLAGLLLPVPAEAERRRRGGLRIQINSSPPGATIYLEGEEESSGTTPQWIDLRRQTYRVRLELDGYAPLEDEINVRRAWLRFNFDLERLGRIELRNTDATARGATVAIDGEEVGTIPLSHELIPGRHSFTVSREGYHDVTRWFEVAGGQNYVVDLALRPVPPPQGEVLIASDVSGAEVSIDGSPAGTTPMIAELEPGEHAIEIRAEGLEPHSEVVTVEAGQRVTLSATLQPSRPPGGTLVVITAPPGATVVVDGNDRGTAPITVEELTPGSHIVEARLEGHQEVTERVDIEEGRQATLRLELEEIPEGGGLRVTSTVEGAEVLLDGEPIGRAPLTHRDIEPGEHVVVVRAAGHREWERRINIESGVDLMVEATPDGFGRLNVTSDVEGAEVVIDEQVVGTVPLTGHELATGDHTVVIRAEGREPFRTTVTVEAGTTHQVAAQLGGAAAASTGPSEPIPPPQEYVPDRSGPRYSRSGFGPPPLSVYIDATWGWPYFIGAYRIGMGIWDGVDWARLDAAIEARSAYWVTEIDFRLRFGTRFARVVRIGAELGLGAAIGAEYDTVTTENRAGFILNLVLTESIVLNPVAFGLTQRLEVFVDTHGQDGSTGLIRHGGARVFVGGFVEVSVHRMVHVFVLADYAPAQTSRRIYCADAWDGGTNTCPHSWMRDINLNVQAGIGLRFR